MRDGCNSYRGPYLLSKCDDKPVEVPKMKKPTMPIVVTEEEDIEETTTTTIIHDDSEDKVDEAKKEVEPSSSKQIKSHPPPLKAYKPKIAYPQRRHGMPNYGKFLKDLIATKVMKEELDALLDDSKPFSTTSEKISESSLDFEFMEIKMEEIPEKEEEVKDNFEELPLEEN
nr:hypothetical protein [Tanacetum cinerariifolium]